MTTRQTRRLWQHVQTLDNFWETLNELEVRYPGTDLTLVYEAPEVA